MMVPQLSVYITPNIKILHYSYNINGDGFVTVRYTDLTSFKVKTL